MQRDESDRLILETPGDNAPTCPACGNWNAMLHKRDPDRDYKSMHCCRDCGFAVDKDKTVIACLELDKPGMGTQSTYHEVRRIPGDAF